MALFHFSWSVHQKTQAAVREDKLIFLDFICVRLVTKIYTAVLFYQFSILQLQYSIGTKLSTNNIILH